MGWRDEGSAYYVVLVVNWELLASVEVVAELSIYIVIWVRCVTSENEHPDAVMMKASRHNGLIITVNSLHTVS